MSAATKLSLQSHDVHVLEEPKAERIVGVEERPDDGVGELLFDELAGGHVVTFSAV
jgi:hypothetical protein